MSAIAAYQTSVAIQQADSDAELVEIWLQTHRSVNTRTAYAADVAAFLRLVDKPFRSMTIKDALAWDQSLVDCAPATAAPRLAWAKSWIPFPHPIGFLSLVLA